MEKIMVVDDEVHIRKYYFEELTDEGFEVVTHDSGFHLLDHIKEEKPDIIVLDIKMLDYNGLDLLQDIRNKYRELPVILCTAYDTFKEDLKSVAADYYVLKSFDLTELKNKVKLASKSNSMN
jgi:two-component system response regulator (stage 0 sporulation protein F)